MDSKSINHFRYLPRESVELKSLLCTQLIRRCIHRNFQMNRLSTSGDIDPGRRIRDGSGRNTSEVTGTWKQYSDRKISGFFPVHSDHFPVLSRQELVGNHRKKSGNFPAGILLPCSDDFRCIPAVFIVFSASFLQVPSGSGHQNLRPGKDQKSFFII